MTPRINKIVKGFEKNIKELESIADIAHREAAAHDEEIEHLTTRRNELSEEKLHALGIANKFRALISA